MYLFSLYDIKRFLSNIPIYIYIVRGMFIHIFTFTIHAFIIIFVIYKLMQSPMLRVSLVMPVRENPCIYNQLVQSLYFLATSIARSFTWIFTTNNFTNLPITTLSLLYPCSCFNYPALYSRPILLFLPRDLHVSFIDCSRVCASIYIYIYTSLCATLSLLNVTCYS